MREIFALSFLGFVMIRSVSVVTSKQVLNTCEEFRNLDFQVSNNSAFWAWDDVMERRYWENLKTWETKPLEVYVIPFSHVDAFWLKTFEDYYSSSVSRILDNVVFMLPQLPDMKFVWSDIAFLQHWWERARVEQKNELQHLVDAGRVEIVTGGWIMPDESVTSLHGLVTVLAEGHEWLNENLHVLPKTSWSLDPFGVGRTWPAILAASQVNGGHLIQRTHWAWQLHFGRLGHSEFVWIPHEVSLNNSHVNGRIIGTGPHSEFQCEDSAPNPERNTRSSPEKAGDGVKLRVQHSATYVMGDSCGPCSALCGMFDFADDSNTIAFTNVRQQAEVLLGQYGRLASLSKQNKAVILLGGDFRFANTSEWKGQYFNYKALMDYINSNFEQYHARVRFATLNDYFSQVSDPEIEIQGDFFPYSDYSFSCKVRKTGNRKCQPKIDYWTGYFTSRPYLKSLSYKLGKAIRAFEIFLAFGCGGFAPTGSNADSWAQDFRRELIWIRRVYSLFQHHDGITGTSKAEVMKQQANRLHRAERLSTNMIERLAAGFLRQHLPQHHVNNSQPAERMLIFNTIETASTDLRLLNLSRSFGRVELAMHDQPVRFQIVCTETDQLIWFKTVVPPFSLKILDVAQHSGEASCLESSEAMKDSFVLGNNWVNVNFENGSLKSLTLAGGSEICMHIKLATYDTENGSNGAYLFKPKSKAVYLLPIRQTRVRNGSLFQEVSIEYDCANVSLKIDNTDEHPGLQVTVEYLLISNDKELFLEIGTSIQSTRWLTDSNDFEFSERENVKTLGLEANTYPMTALTYVEGDGKRLALIADHCHGVANPRPGVLQVMLDRRASEDDGKGIEEPLVDNVRTISRFLVIAYEFNKFKLDLLGISRRFSNPPIMIKVQANLTAKRERESISRNEIIRERRVVVDYQEQHLGGRAVTYSRRVYTRIKTTSSPVILKKRFHQPSDGALRFIYGTDIAEGVRIVAIRNLLYGDSGRRALIVLHNTNNHVTKPFAQRVQFGFVRLVGITQTSLTGIVDGEDVACLTEISIQPHGLKSIKLHFEPKIT